MALGFYFTPTAMTLAKYQETIAQLKKAGAQHPPGRRYHACMGTPDAVQVFDVWDSQAQFDKFGATLIPIMASMGMDPGQPMVAEVHNVIVPPAKVKAAPKAKAKPRSRAAAKKKAGKAKK